MKILFNVSHPAHVHLFKNAIKLLEKKGHTIKIASIEKELTIYLLNKFNFAYTTIGKSEDILLRKSITVLKKDIALWKLTKRFLPNLIVSTGSPYAAHVGKMLNIPSVAFSDTEIAKLVIQLMQPFTTAICTPSCFNLNLGDKHIKYDGYHELAYLHPNYFKPHESVLEELGLAKDDKFIIVRLSSKTSSHDIVEKGFDFRSESALVNFIKRFEKYGKVFITSEIKVSGKLKNYVLKTAPERIHDVLAFSTLYIGEGATMASEASVLGVPWIFVSNSRRGYLDEQEKKYALGYTISDAKNAVEKGIELLEIKNIKHEWQKKRKKLLNEKIDVTKFIVDFIEKWPESFELAKKGRFL